MLTTQKKQALTKKKQKELDDKIKRYLFLWIKQNQF